MKDLPTHIALNMTSACNMDCSYCYQDKLNSGKRMSTKVLDSLIEMLAATPEDQRFRVSFFGGEPTLASRNIEYFIDKANLNKIEGFSLTTNGTNIEVVNRIARRGFEMSNGRIRTNVLFSNKDVLKLDENLDLSVVDNSYRYIIGVDTIAEVTPELITELLESEYTLVDFRFDYYANWDEADETQVNEVIELLETFGQVSNRIRFNLPKKFVKAVRKKCPLPHMSIDTDGSLMPCHRMFNSTRGIGMAVGNIVTNMTFAVNQLKAFHDTTHYSSACVGFSPNFGQDNNIHVISLGAAKYHERSEPMIEGLMVAVPEPGQQCN